MKERKVEAIGIIHTDYKEKFGIPRQSGRVKSARGRIELFEPYNDPTALRGLEKISHIWLIFDFSECEYSVFSPTVRPPRLGGNERTGVFATRSPFRPNRLGLSCVKLEEITDKGELIVSGIDMLDKTPIFDIKPYIPYTDNVPDAKGGFAQEHKNHRLISGGGTELLEILPENIREAALDSILDDPRPSYQNDSERIYSMRFSDFDIHFRVENEKVFITGVEQK